MGALVSDFDSPLPALLYWDASFLVHATYPGGRYHRACYAFLERLSGAGDTLSLASTLTLDEAIFALIQLKVMEDHPDQSFWEIYRENSRVIQPHLGELRALVDRLAIDPRIRLIGTEPEELSTMLDYMDRYAVLPRDALHLSTMDRYGADTIVTTDDDFLSVDGLQIVTCNPRILAHG